MSRFHRIRRPCPSLLPGPATNSGLPPSRFHRIRRPWVWPGPATKQRLPTSHVLFHVRRPCPSLPPARAPRPLSLPPLLPRPGRLRWPASTCPVAASRKQACLRGSTAMFWSHTATQRIRLKRPNLGVGVAWEWHRRSRNPLWPAPICCWFRRAPRVVEGSCMTRCHARNSTLGHRHSWACAIAKQNRFPRSHITSLSGGVSAHEDETH